MCCCQVLKAVGDEDEKYPYPFELTVRVQLGQQGDAPTFTQEVAANNTGQQDCPVRFWQSNGRQPQLLGMCVVSIWGRGCSL